MSAPHQYHSPNAPDPSEDDSESDLDMELGELAAPPAQESTSPPTSRRTSRDHIRDFAARIPLRNLRVGRRAKRRESEDELLHDGVEGEDDEPLLPAHYGRRSHLRTESSFSRFGSMVRIPSFGSGSHSRRSSLLPEGEVEEEPTEEHDPTSTREVLVGRRQPTRFPLNVVSNAKYTPWSFLPRTLYNEFKFFLNMYFLLVALSQIIPQLRIGYLSTYILPLAFVLSITLGKEAWDDISRRRRDGEANAEPYTVLRFEEVIFDISGLSRSGKKKKTQNGNLSAIPEGEESNGNAKEPSIRVQEITKPSRDLKVGDVLKLRKNDRVPADLVILRSVVNDLVVTNPNDSASQQALEAAAALIEDDQQVDGPSSSGNNNPDSELTGEAFIRTDQLDGETDWKLRLAPPLTQNLALQDFAGLKVTAGKPDKRVNDFVGNIELVAEDGETAESSTSRSAPLSIDNTAWANTVLASSSIVYAVVVYTGSQTRQALSTSPSRSKVGLLELEINSLTKILCVLTLTLSLVLVLIGGLERENKKWYISVMRYLILFSTVVPISLRVNLDMAKTVYAWLIEHDKGILGTVVRTSTIPEDLGRIEYLLSDKTGTLTQNEMELKKVHVGTVSYANEAMEEVASYVNHAFAIQEDDTKLVTPSTPYVAPVTSTTRMRREIGSRVRDLVLALALCHNVTPTVEEEDGGRVASYQASSPDEIAIVKWTESVGLRLIQRDRHHIALQSTKSGMIVVEVRILNMFPFTSDTKRMGIAVCFSNNLKKALQPSIDDNAEIWFYQKGADTVMSSIVASNDWLEEETANMAREGLRTLVVGRKKLSSSQYNEFSNKYAQASLSLQARDAAMSAVVKEYLERDLELLGVTGVEDKLQRDVKPSLELLRNAGIKIWMLTGDKVETARCVAISSKLVARGQYIHTVQRVKRKDHATNELDFLRGKTDACLLIDGESLALMLQHYRDDFIGVAVRLPAVVACRCSPDQKASVARLIRSHTKKRVCCIGDGGNDVSMIQAADVGVGIVGKEGRQASLAADFSVTQFCHLTKLLVWHGRNCYKRSAKLAQFIIHRGLAISVCQAMFSIASKFEPNALYRDWLLVGYATIYTLAPVFSLVLDKDVDEGLANLYPELYKELTEGRSLSYRTFFIWVAVSVYQGCMIQGLSQLLVGLEKFQRMVAVSYTVLILNELLMVAVEITTWHPIMILSIIGTAGVYFGSVPFLGDYYDLAYMVSVGFLWRTVLILAIALIPPYAGKILGRTLRPPSYRKVRGV